MIVLPMADANVFGNVWGSLDFPIPKNPIGLRQSSRRLVDIWSIFQGSPQGFRGIAYTGLERNPFTTNRGLTTLNAVSSKKKPGKTNDLDNDENLLTEDDIQYKPLGFGQGKSYDTSLEDQLLEQIERDKAAQSAALARQKNSAASKKKSKELVAKPTLEHPSTVNGIRVFVGELPKKRNIDRDLRSAFRHIPGLLDISPTVVGNEKTRDPVCKGFGFLTFDTIDHAESFISAFKGKPVSFGKVEKQLTVEVIQSREEVDSLQVYDQSSEEDSDDDFDSGDEPEIEISCLGDIGDPSDDSVLLMHRPQRIEGHHLNEAERRIEELENRLRKKLENGGFNSQNIMHEEQVTKPRGFKSRKSGASKQSSSKGNNVAAVTHGLRKRERECMTGVLEKYGRSPSTTKP